MLYPIELVWIVQIGPNMISAEGLPTMFRILLQSTNKVYLYSIQSRAYCIIYIIS